MNVIRVILPDFIALCHYDKQIQFVKEELQRVDSDEPDPLLLAINDLVDEVNNDNELAISKMWTRYEILYDNIDKFKLNKKILQIHIIQLSRKGDTELSERVKKEVHFPGFLF